MTTIESTDQIVDPILRANVQRWVDIAGITPAEALTRLACGERADDFVLNPGEPTIEDLLVVAEAWASPDDWDVPSIYTSTIRDLVVALRAGIGVGLLAAHAKHVDADCAGRPCSRLHKRGLNGEPPLWDEH